MRLAEPDQLRRGAERGPVEALARRDEARRRRRRRATSRTAPTSTRHRRSSAVDRLDRLELDRATDRRGGPRPARDSRNASAVAAGRDQRRATRSRRRSVAIAGGDPRQPRCGEVVGRVVPQQRRPPPPPSTTTGSGRPARPHSISSGTRSSSVMPEPAVALGHQQAEHAHLGRGRPTRRGTRPSPSPPVGPSTRRPTAPPHAARTASGGHRSASSARTASRNVDLVVGAVRIACQAVTSAGGRARARRRCCAGSRWCRRRSGPDRANS